MNSVLPSLDGILREEASNADRKAVKNSMYFQYQTSTPDEDEEEQ
jgi:hypothetical protein